MTGESCPTGWRSPSPGPAGRTVLGVIPRECAGATVGAIRRPPHTLGNNKQGVLCLHSCGWLELPKAQANTPSPLTHQEVAEFHRQLVSRTESLSNNNGAEEKYPNFAGCQHFSRRPPSAALQPPGVLHCVNTIAIIIRFLSPEVVYILSRQRWSPRHHPLGDSVGRQVAQRYPHRQLDLAQCQHVVLTPFPTGLP